MNALTGGSLGRFTQISNFHQRAILRDLDIGTILTVHILHRGGDQKSHGFNGF